MVERSRPKAIEARVMLISRAVWHRYIATWRAWAAEAEPRDTYLMCDKCDPGGAANAYRIYRKQDTLDSKASRPLSEKVEPGFSSESGLNS